MTVLHLFAMEPDAFIVGPFRYWLTRPLPVRRSGPPLVVCMLNPSTADASTDDQTIRKLYGFAERLGRAGVVVVNAYAFRARHPRDMRAAADPVGPLNDGVLALLGQLMRATIDDPEVVVAWGKHCAPARAKAVATILEREGARLVSWGRNGDGSPPHPLLLPYSTPLEPWSPPA